MTYRMRPWISDEAFELILNYVHFVGEDRIYELAEILPTTPFLLADIWMEMFKKHNSYDEQTNKYIIIHEGEYFDDGCQKGYIGGGEEEVDFDFDGFRKNVARIENAFIQLEVIIKLDTNKIHISKDKTQIRDILIDFLKYPNPHKEYNLPQEDEYDY